MCLLRTVGCLLDLKALLLGTVLYEVTPSPLLFPQRSQSAFSLSREDALRTSSLEAASRQPKDQQPREEAALPNWKSVDRLDETSNCSKQHLLGLWVSKMLLGGSLTGVWLFSPSSHGSE